MTKTKKFSPVTEDFLKSLPATGLTTRAHVEELLAGFCTAGQEAAVAIFKAAKPALRGTVFDFLLGMYLQRSQDSEEGCGDPRVPENAAVYRWMYTQLEIAVPAELR